ncbi:disks large-associated protein 5-like [Acanthaster planci]|uniref:Disks large-associated protein 5-like n=1 Tax=Acanthaster planci TaxID=133434 RepID=A0A8B7Y904_ACAPL|nr:disks large-associated protein 5-like [Acanthaster planci]
MDFSYSYKKKGLGLDAREKRFLRVKRRSVDQRLQRDETYMKHRDIGSLTPLKENTDENVQKNISQPTAKTRQGKSAAVQKAAKPTADVQAVASTKAETAGTLARREMLQKWKREKELKKKLALEKEKQKPMFKVYKVTHDKRPTNLSVVKAPVPTKPQVQKDTPALQRRVTRALTKAASSKSVTSQSKPSAPVTAAPAKRVTRQSARLASKSEDQKENRQAQKTKPAAKTSIEKTKAPVTEPTAPPPVEPTKLPSPTSTQHVTSERGNFFQFPDIQPSFAPANFTFNFQFEPMSPASTQNFLFPETALRKGRCSTPRSASRRKRATSPQPLEISAIHSPKKSLLQDPPPQNKKEDVSYFRDLLVTETTKLNDLCSKWEAVQRDTDLSDDVSGEIRCTIGKAQLLIDQRFKQFSGLVDNCEFGLGEKKTHCSDLTGFWDMIYFQVEDVLGRFASLDQLQANHWAREETKVEPARTKKIVKKAKLVTKSQSNKDREAARERLAAIKATMKARQTRAKAAEQVVFEGGFFKVESPVRTPASHCEAGSPFKVRPSHTSGSNANTPLAQGYTPKNARRSIQGKLCGTLSKLVLGEVTAPVSKSAMPVSKVTTPLSKVATPSSQTAMKNITMTIPDKKVATPVGEIAMAESQVATPLKLATPYRTDSREDDSSSVSTSHTCKDDETQNLLTKYLQPSVLSIVDLNQEAEKLMQTEPQQQLADLGVRSQLSNTPRTRSRSRSSVLLPGLNSPHLCRTPTAFGKVSFSSVFTPPPGSCTSTSQVGGDLIHFDSPAPVTSVAEAPSAESLSLPNSRPAPPTDLNGDAVKATVRRSIRLRHHSACSPQTATHTQAKVAKSAYRPNLSMM